MRDTTRVQGSGTTAGTTVAQLGTTGHNCGIAAQWLSGELADGEWVASGKIKARAKAENIAVRTLQRARVRLGVEDRREGFPAVSEWRLPRAREKTASTTGVRELFAYWQEQCGHPQAKLSPERRGKIEGRLREGFTAPQIQEAIDGAARGAFVNEAGKRFDDIELICRNATKLESFIGRPAAAARRESPSDLLRAMGFSA